LVLSGFFIFQPRFLLPHTHSFFLPLAFDADEVNFTFLQLKVLSDVGVRLEESSTVISIPGF